MRRRSQGNEELTSVCPWPTVRHADRTFLGVLEFGVELVFEFAAVDRRAPTTCAGRL